jgi:hypothetical protein
MSVLAVDRTLLPRALTRLGSAKKLLRDGPIRYFHFDVLRWVVLTYPTDLLCCCVLFFKFTHRTELKRRFFPTSPTH